MLTLTHPCIVSKRRQLSCSKCGEIGHTSRSKAHHVDRSNEDEKLIDAMYNWGYPEIQVSFFYCVPQCFTVSSPMTEILNLFCSRFTRKPKMFWICSADLRGIFKYTDNTFLAFQVKKGSLSHKIVRGPRGLRPEAEELFNFHVGTCRRLIFSP